MVKPKKAKKNTGKKSGSKKPVKKKSAAKKPLKKVSKSKKAPAKKSKKTSPVKKKLKGGASNRIKGKQVPKNKKLIKPVSKAKKTTVAKKSKAVKETTVKKTKASVVSTLKKGTTVIKGKKQLIKGNTIQQNPKNKIDPEEKLHSKTQRIMKELEETMDLEKVKPRIKVPNFVVVKPRVVPVLKLVEPTNTKKEKYQLEFEFRSSKSILFSYLSDSSGMAGWFADEVHSNDHNYTFVWEGSETHAKLVAIKDQLLVRFEWTDENDGTYFQFEIKEDDITSDIALLITDWANPGEKEAAARLWESQVGNLRQLIGSV